jgi:hypothetical protein
VFALGAPFPGKKCLHASFAAVNRGELGSMAGVTTIWTLPPSVTGSGMSGSPWVRMQCTKARALLGGLAVLPPFAVDGAVVAVVVPRPATGASSGEHTRGQDCDDDEAGSTEPGMCPP